MDIQEIATELLQSLDHNMALQPIVGRVPGFDEQAAYEVSAAILERRRARGERPIGRKIGFTNRTMWSHYGVEAPIWAPVYDSTVTFQESSTSPLSIGHLAQPRIEPEIVFHFKTSPGPSPDEAALLSCIDWIAHGYEIVQCHFPDWKFQAPDTIAAFGLHGALVVGRGMPVTDILDSAMQLRSFTIALARNGSVEARGRGADVLDSPLLAAAHLVRVLERQSLFEGIQAGEIVTTGTLTSPLPIHPGETWTAELPGINLEGVRLQLA